MITKAIIEQIIDDYSAKVRIPIYNQLIGAPTATPTEQLYTAYFCMPPGCKANYVEGEVVYVDFELDEPNKPIVLGVLSRKDAVSSVDVKAGAVEISTDLHLMESSQFKSSEFDTINAALDILTNTSASGIEVSKELAAQYASVNKSSVEAILWRLPVWGAYLSFVGNVNAEQVAATFGKNNEEFVSGLGLALAMFARYKDPGLSIDLNFPSLRGVDTITQMREDLKAAEEWLSNINLKTFIFSCAYAKNFLISSVTSVHAVTGSSNSDVSASGTIIITQEHLDGKKLLYFDNYITDNRSYGLSYMNLNGVRMLEIAQGTVEYRKKMTPELLADFNITAPGEYPIYCLASTGSSSDKAYVYFDAYETNNTVD